MGGVMSQLDWVALAVSLVAHFFDLGLEGRWTDTVSRKNYSRWRTVLNSWIAFPGWIWQPLLFVVQALAATGVFLYWRNNFTATGQHGHFFVAIMALTIVNVFFLHMWTPSLLWGPNYWWLAALNSFMVFGTSVSVVAIMGARGGAWLPFGVYITYPIFAFIVMIATGFMYWNSALVERIVTSADTRTRAARRAFFNPEAVAYETLGVPETAERRLPRASYGRHMRAY